MTIELITGHAGSAHVSSADAGWFNAGIIGQESYILETGNQFEATEQSANLVTIGTGDAVFQGRHVRVSAPENVSIDNGAQGMKRNDIICIKYVNANSVESASLEVLKGTATSETPTDPAIPSGNILDGATEAYMPLWRIPVNGIALEAPVAMYGDTVAPLSGLSGTIGISKGGTGAVTAAGARASLGVYYSNATVLFDDDSNTSQNISLLQSAENFDKMVICYRTNVQQYASVEAWHPNQKYVALGAVANWASDDNIWLKQQVVYVNGSSITPSGNGHQANISAGGTYMEASRVIFITQVIGYKN